MVSLRRYTLIIIVGVIELDSTFLLEQCSANAVPGQQRLILGGIKSWMWICRQLRY
jgi:hypothetical protein